jgi:O-antigen/teichoic acid export membrane protein
MFKKYKGYIVTFGTEITIMCLSFLIFRIANQQLSEFGFSEYNVFRRTTSLLLPLLMIGLGVAIPRFISLEKNRNSLFLTGIIWIFISSIILISILFFGVDFFSKLFFGSISYKLHIISIGFLLMNFGFHSCIYGYLRGKLNVYFSNFIQLLNTGIIPLFVFFISSNILEIIVYNVLFLFCSCLIFTLVLIKKHKIKLKINYFKEDSKILLNYGLPRVIGDFSLLAILSLPTYIILKIENNLLIAGDVAYGITLLNLAGAIFSPLSLVLLPEISTFLIEKNIKSIVKRFKIFIILSLSLTLIGYFVFYFLSEFVLLILLGKGYHNSIGSFSKIILMGSFGYVLYIVLRSFLDAIHVKATNSLNLLIVLCFNVLLVYVGIINQIQMEYYLFTFVVSLSLLGLLSLIKTYKAIKKIK